MFFNSIKKINRFRREINMFLSKGMSNIYLKVIIEKKWHTQNFYFLSLKVRLTVLERLIICFSLYTNWEKRAFFVTFILSKGNFCNICVLSQCIICIYVYIYVCVCVCIYIYIYVCVCLSIYLYLYLSIYLSIYIYIYLSIYIYIYIYIYIRSI